MSPQNLPADTDEMRPDYDFSQGVRGKHFQSYRRGTNVVFLEPDLVEAFPDSQSVNQALRLLVRLAKTKTTIVTGSRKVLRTSGSRPKSRSKTRSRAARG